MWCRPLLPIHGVIGLETWSDRPDRIEILSPTHHPIALQDQISLELETVGSGSDMIMALCNEELLMLGAAAVALTMKVKKKSKKRKWSREWLLKRQKFSHISLLEELESDDCCNYLRMDQETYLELLSLVTPHIEKNDTIICVRQ